MSPKLALFCQILIASSCFGDNWRRYYTIVAPRTVRSLSEYPVSISLTDVNQSCWFNISISVAKKTMSIRGSEILKIQTVEVQPWSTKLIKLQMPRLNYSSGYLKISGYGGIVTIDEEEIDIEEVSHMAYIQTDKMSYKPGEKVQFRVICIDRWTRPAQVNEDITVHIYDGQQNLIKELSNLKLVQGVFKGDLQLSEYPVLGEWKIEVRANGRLMQERTFQVLRIVLPKFSVDITTKKDVAVDDGELVLTVKASYTYGEPIKGNLTINLQTIDSAVKQSNPNITKELQIDGETTVMIDFKSDLNITRNPSVHYPLILYKFNIKAMVQDALTMQYSDTNTEIAVHNNPYKIQIEAPESFDPEKLFNLTVSVTDLENTPIRDKINPVKVTVEGLPEDFLKKPVSIKNVTLYLTENGDGVISLNLTDDVFERYELKAEYLGWISHIKSLQKNPRNTFNLDILTERPQVGKELVILVKSLDPIDYFVYEIVSHDDIIHSERINVPGNETTYPLRINATHKMVPKITLFVHRIKNSAFDGSPVFDSRLKDVSIKRAFHDSIKIETDSEVKPRTPVSINVTTDEGSYVGLMAIDERFLITSTTNKDDLTEDHIFTNIHNYDSLNMKEMEQPGLEAGLLTLSNAIEREIGPRIGEKDDKIPGIQPPYIRNVFPESWIFKDFERTPVEGLRLHETIPDTITSWAITAFSLNSKTGISLTKNATKIKVFQKFFISMNIPGFVKEGEIIEIPVYVFNYMEKDLWSNVTIDDSSGELQLLESLNSSARLQPNKTISTYIPSQGRVKLVFLVRPRHFGRYNVTVKAISLHAVDAVQKTLIVAPEGVPYSLSKTYLVNFLHESEQEDEISVDIPPNTVHGSENIHLSVVGDIFGPLLRSLEDLVKVPYGNGEENIRYLVSNLLALKYLKVLNHSNPSLESKAQLHLELGYQTQLTFKLLDGSFSFFDRSDGKPGDVWLTAYVMWGLQQATNFMHVHPHVIDRGLNFLKSKQGKDGGFNSGGDVEEDVVLTAFILLSFLIEQENEHRYQDVIIGGLTYLQEIVDDLEQSIPAVISAYVLVLGKHEKSGELLTKLTTHASFTSKPIIWTKTDNLQSSLETTASSFMSLLEFQENPVQTLLPIVRALISTTQYEKIPTHMIALEAMIKFAQEMDFGRKDLKIQFNDHKGVSGSIHINSSNAQILQTIKLTESSRKIRLQSKGHGFAIVNVKYAYNLPPQNQSLSNYETNVTVKELINHVLILETCVALRSVDYQSNLPAMEVNLQSGYTFDEKTFEEVQKINAQVKSIVINGNEGSVLVYFGSITKAGICIQLKALRVFNVFNTKLASLVVYDLRKKDQRSISFYVSVLCMSAGQCRQRISGDYY